MMRSLWSGVSGLQAHQTAMDVEGNNIANVNTTGFKYSRTNFADMLSQTSKISTAPEGNLGGRNSLQVGLGTAVSTVTHVFSQGSRQSTDVTTDCAIQGDGFFVVSGDGGNTYKYTRDGEFSFDAYGKFVNGAGYIVQGWTADKTTDTIDSTTPISNISIDPGMTIAAKPTTSVTLRANLDSGSTSNETSSIYALDSDSATIADPTIANGVNGNQQPEDLGILYNASGSAFNLENGQGVWIGFTPTVMNETIAAGGSQSVNITLNGINISGTVGYTTPSVSTATDNATEIASLINTYSSQTGVTASASGGTLTFTNNNQTDGDTTKNIALTVNGSDTSGLSSGSAATAYKYQYTSGSANPATDSTSIGQTKNFHTTEDLRAYLQWQADATSTGAKVIVNSDGKYEISNQTGSTLAIAVTGISNSSTTNNTTFTTVMNALEGTLPAGSATKVSQAVTAAVHTTSTDIYDSLGSKHTITYEFRRTSENTWSWTASIPQPGDIGGAAPNKNVFTGGTVQFNSNGSLSSINPQSVQATFNNGSTPNQQVNLAFGTANAFDGLTSTDAKSATSLISQDGYTSGTLNGESIDENGNIVGTFSNGQQLVLAKIAMATFANNEGLEADGSNMYTRTANSGDPTVGAANSGGRGQIYASALEMSNVDLSKSLTELIVIQRGYQANSKTITTSDQMLQTLLSIKQ